MKKLEAYTNLWLEPKGDKWVLCHGYKELMVFSDRDQGVIVARKMSRDMALAKKRS